MPVPAPLPARTGLAARLRAAGCVWAEEEADVLLDAAGSDGEQLERLVVRRAAGEPLEQVVGWAGFAGTRVVVAPGVFVPRARTAALVDLAAREVERMAGDRTSPVVVLDLCCGSGAVGAALLHALGTRPGAVEVELWAADVDPVACACARQNLPGARVVQGDLFAALPGSVRGRIDVVVANAPYVPSDAVATMPREAREHEPRGTLDGGPDGLGLQRRVVAEASGWLAASACLVMETSRRQAPASREILRAAGWDARVVTDDDLDATAVVGHRGD